MPAIAERRMPRPLKRLTAKEAAKLGEFGAFARHLAGLLEERGISPSDFAEACRKAKLPIQGHQVRAWLRGDNMPQAHMLRPLARVLKLDDERHILPE